MLRTGLNHFNIVWLCPLSFCPSRLLLTSGLTFPTAVLSPLKKRETDLFAIALEPLIRPEATFPGVHIGSVAHKLMLYAGDILTQVTLLSIIKISGCTVCSVCTVL